MFAGHPPLIINFANWDISIPPVLTVSCVPSSIFNKEASPEESPDSYKLIVYIFNLPILPAPEWCTFSFMTLSGNVVEPVIIKFPFSVVLSHSRLTASHIVGTKFHSSISSGFFSISLLKTDFTSNSAIFLILSSSIKTALFEFFNDVHVFPHHFGPSILTAPNTDK